VSDKRVILLPVAEWNKVDKEKETLAGTLGLYAVLEVELCRQSFNDGVADGDPIVISKPSMCVKPGMDRDRLVVVLPYTNEP